MQITSFRGLNNVTDPLRLGMGWLAQADNVDITDTGALVKRSGYTLERASAFASAYSTLDFSRMYLATATAIQTFAGESIAALTSNAPVYWTEANNNVYYNNGIDSGVIAPDHSVDLWRDKPRSYGAGFKGDDGQDLAVLYDTLPHDTDVIQFWKGRMYASQPMISDDQSVVWASEPMGYHLWNLDSNFFIVPGRVLMLAPTKDALIVGTATRIYAYSADGITQLADYGVVAGKPWDADGDRMLVWTVRGLCSVLPFQNLTEKQVSVAPGAHVAGCVLRAGGQKRFVACLQQGKEAFNAYP